MDAKMSKAIYTYAVPNPLLAVVRIGLVPSWDRLGCQVKYQLGSHLDLKNPSRRKTYHLVGLCTAEESLYRRGVPALCIADKEPSLHDPNC